MGCRCTSLTRSGGRHRKAAPGNSASIPGTRPEPSNRGPAECTDAAAPVPRLALFPARTQDGGVRRRASDEKGPARHVCWVVPPSPAERGSTVAGPTEDESYPRAGVKVRLPPTAPRVDLHAENGSRRRTGGEVRPEPTECCRRRAEAPAPLMPSERLPSVSDTSSKAHPKNRRPPSL